MNRVLVVGDSVPRGERTDATRWPDRLPDLVEGVASVTVRGGMGVSLVDLADDPDRVAGDAGTVLVHAGHNDAQLSGGQPRVPEADFRAAAERFDAHLRDRSRVRRHAFVGLVPLLPLDRPGTVPFDDAQPERSLAYDDALGGSVGTHLPVARPVADWRDRTADGVHPNDAGHGYVAERVAAWLG